MHHHLKAPLTLESEPISYLYMRIIIRLLCVALRYPTFHRNSFWWFKDLTLSIFLNMKILPVVHTGASLQNLKILEVKIYLCHSPLRWMFGFNLLFMIAHKKIADLRF